MLLTLFPWPVGRGGREIRREGGREGREGWRKAQRAYPSLGRQADSLSQFVTGVVNPDMTYNDRVLPVMWQVPVRAGGIPGMLDAQGAVLAAASAWGAGPAAAQQSRRSHSHEATRQKKRRARTERESSR